MRGISEGKLQCKYPILHRGGTVSYWSFSRQEWMKDAIFVPVEDLADMHPYDRKRIVRHLGHPEDSNNMAKLDQVRLIPTGESNVE
jgi:hypothetical protein